MLTDQELARLSIDNPENYNALVLRYWRPLSNFLMRRFDRERDWAEDIVQEAMLRALANLKRYDPGKKWSTWLFGIALNIARTDLSKQRPLPLENFFPSNFSCETSADSLLALNRVERVISTLPPEHQKILKMHLAGQLSSEEMAKQLKMPAFAVKLRIGFALRELVSKYYIDS